MYEHQAKSIYFDAHCSAFTVVATCQIWWKFVNKFLVIAETLGLLFSGHGEGVRSATVSPHLPKVHAGRLFLSKKWTCKKDLRPKFPTPSPSRATLSPHLFSSSPSAAK